MFSIIEGDLLPQFNIGGGMRNARLAVCITFLVIPIITLSYALVFASKSHDDVHIQDVGAKIPEACSRIQVGEEVFETYETAHPYEGTGNIWERSFHWTDASYITIHFVEFDLASEDYVEISSPDGKYTYRYEGKGKVVRGGEAILSVFWTRHIPGDTAVVRLYSVNPTGAWGFKIDKWAHGYKSGVTMSAICGADDKEWAACYDGTDIYEMSRTVARLLVQGSSACTGWLIGSEGHLMTNNHCIGSQDDADNTDY